MGVGCLLIFWVFAMLAVMKHLLKMPYNLFVLSAASATGKTTIAQRLLSQDKRLVRVVSYTTRTPRSDETIGMSYRFISPDLFEKYKKEGYFCEHTSIYGESYGVALHDIKEQLQKSDVLLIVDWHGAEVVSQMFERVVKIFILAPSVAALRARLVARDKEAADTKVRLKAAAHEVAHAEKYDYWVVNDCLEQAVHACQSIVAAERLKVSVQGAAVHALVAEFAEGAS